jgi:hypothetical protein
MAAIMAFKSPAGAAAAPVAVGAGVGVTGAAAAARAGGAVAVGAAGAAELAAADAESGECEWQWAVGTIQTTDLGKPLDNGITHINRGGFKKERGQVGLQVRMVFGYWCGIWYHGMMWCVPPRGQEENDKKKWGGGGRGKVLRSTSEFREDER